MLADLRFAARTLRKAKGFTFVAVAALALGIGGTAVMYSVVSAVLLQPLPYPQPDRIVRVWETWGPSMRGSVSLEDFVDWRAQSHGLELLTSIQIGSANLAKGGRAERLESMNVSADFFPLLGLAPALGRSFDAEAYAKGANEVLISHDVWQRWFNGGTDVVGSTVALGDAIYTVVGVLPAGFRMPGAAPAVIMPLGPVGHGRGSHYLFTIARLAPGTGIDAATTELNTVMQRLEAAYPDSNRDRRVVIEGWHDNLVARLKPSVLLLFGAVVLVLLIACANVANMLMARAAAREGELAVRFALGASRWRVVRQLLTESAVLAGLGAAVGLLLAAWGVDLSAAIMPQNGVFTVHLDVTVVAFALIVAVISVLVFGLVPALRAASADVQVALKEGTRAVAGGRTRLKNALVVGQVAISFALLVGAGLLGRSFLRLAAVDPGFDPAHVVTLQVALPKGKDEKLYFDRLLNDLQTTPGVSAAGVTDFLPLSQNNMNGDFQIEGRPFPPDAHPITEYMIATPGYFEAIGMRIVAGRGITAADRADARPVMVINQRMAKKYWPDENPVGKRMRFGDEGQWSEIVGVVNDVKRWSLADDQAQPETWMPFAQVPESNMALAVRGPGDERLLAETVRRVVQRVDPEQAVFAVATMTHLLDDTLRDRRLIMTFLVAFAGIALGLAAIGLYGVLAVQVAQRTRELGIRMALGARPSVVRALVVGHGLRLAGAGVLVGAGVAFFLSGVLDKLLFGVSRTDPITFIGVGLGLIAVAFIATWLPARRATQIDPMIALRSS